MSTYKQCLNGKWDFMPVFGLKSCLDLPEEISYEKEKIRVPSSWRFVTMEGTTYYSNGFGMAGEFQPFNMFDYPLEWSRADTGIYRRFFGTPEPLASSRVFLRFDGIIQRARIFINGSRVADWEESYLPLEVDITGSVKRDGTENELIVVCSTFEEVIIPSGAAKCLGLAGSWFGNLGRGIWQDVYLECRPCIYIDDVFVKTSYKTNKITADIRICRATTSEEKDLEVHVYILESGAVVKYLGKTDVVLKESAIYETSIETSWTDHHLWMPDDPFCYTARIDLLEKDSITDSKDVRFGFREFWFEGSRFYINGTRINLRGDSWHFQGAVQQTKEYALNWFRMCRENGLNFVRLHAAPYPEYYLDAADEVGMLVVDETAIYGSAKSMPAYNSCYLDMCKMHVERLVKRDRNHPSIVIWSLQNEMRWVDGRDVYKEHIPEMMDIIRRTDGTRPIILEGDNRLLSREDTEIYSLHYNIDGTIAQWDRKRPLIFGEHGGWWYICPQNSSAFIGLKAYGNADDCSMGFAIKEKLYVEYARKSEVSGITSFNFAHYLMRSMPDEDIRMEWGNLETTGCKPKVIRKHSLTINNGCLENYPVYRPNPAMELLKEGYKPVTIIPSEYNSSFYDGSPVERSFNVYNDTLEARKCRVEFAVRSYDAGGASEGISTGVYSKVVEFLQQPGEKKKLNISFLPPKTGKPSMISLEAVLYHDGIEMHRLDKNYKLYPEGYKYQAVDTLGKRVAFYGGGISHKVLEGLIQNLIIIEDLCRLSIELADIAIIGSHLDEPADSYMDAIRNFVENGGVLIQLEQSRFVPGDLIICRQPFFSAHINNPGHKILKGLSDEDFIFWNGGTREETPCSIIEQCFAKPVKGDVEMLLECSAGDFGDGGDLWTPLAEYRYKKGLMLLNQLEIADNYDAVPQACILLRNMLEFAVESQVRIIKPTGLIVLPGSRVYDFVSGLGLDFDLIDRCSDLGRYPAVLADIAALTDNALEDLSSFVHEGGTVFAFPVDKSYETKLQRLTKSKASVVAEPVYHLEKAHTHPLTDSISLVDLFRYEKVPLSPRNVENLPICDNSVEIEGAENLLVSIEGTPWHDYFYNKLSAEYSRIALADMNRKNKKDGRSYLVRKNYGKGCFIVSQLSADENNEKNIRCYARLLSKLGASICSSFFDYTRSEKDYSVDFFMTVPHQEYNDYRKTEAYFSDREYSLNNLGEGLYGWMKKVERNPSDGFIDINQSTGRIFFLSCFVELAEDRCNNAFQPEIQLYKLQIDINCSFRLWVNGSLLMDYKQETSEIKRVTVDGAALYKGINRLILACKVSDGDIRLRPVFILSDGSYPHNLRYRLTLDEVDPK